MMPVRTEKGLEKPTFPALLLVILDPIDASVACKTRRSLRMAISKAKDFLAEGSLGGNKRFPSFVGAGVLNKCSEGIAKNHTASKPLLCLAPELHFRKGGRQSHCEGLQDGLIHMPI